jgi:hypothetical protein
MCWTFDSAGRSVQAPVRRVRFDDAEQRQETGHDHA